MITNKELDNLDILADIMIAEGPIAHRLLRVMHIGLLYKRLIFEIRELRRQNEKPKDHLYIVPNNK